MIHTYQSCGPINSQAASKSTLFPQAEMVTESNNIKERSWTESVIIIRGKSPLFTRKHKPCLKRSTAAVIFREVRPHLSSNSAINTDSRSHRGTCSSNSTADYSIRPPKEAQ